MQYDTLTIAFPERKLFSSIASNLYESGDLDWKKGGIFTLGGARVNFIMGGMVDVFRFGFRCG